MISSVFKTHNFSAGGLCHKSSQLVWLISIQYRLSQISVIRLQCPPRTFTLVYLRLHKWTACSSGIFVAWPKTRSEDTIRLWKKAPIHVRCIFIDGKWRVQGLFHVYKKLNWCKLYLKVNRVRKCAVLLSVLFFISLTF